MPVKIYEVDPIQDPRWAELVDRHPDASVFHTVAWLETLRRTYRYLPLAFTTSPPTSELRNGLVFCQVNSWITGHRLVSLPFSDHCEPLLESVEDQDGLIHFLQSALTERHLKSIEVRPIKMKFDGTGNGTGFRPKATYFLHTLDLRPELDGVFRNLDKDSVQRRVQRAAQAGLVEKSATSAAELKEFYHLMAVARGRHNVPPPPYAWFRNLIDCLGKALEIRLAYQKGTPIAAILTLRFKDIVYYKYGGSDARFHQLGAMPWLLWNAIAAAKSSGSSAFDMGRTDEDDLGLLKFKNHWVPEPQRLVYWTFPGSSGFRSSGDWKAEMAKHLFSYMPERLRIFAGRVIYPHIG